MKLQDWAALVAIIDFAGRAWRRIWKLYETPIRNYLTAVIDGIVAFLIRIRRHLDASDDNDDLTVNGVTGGSVFERFMYIR